MKKLVLLAFACSMLTACGSSESGPSSFNLSSIRPPAAGKINLIFKNLESQALSGAFFSTSGTAGSFTDLMPSAQSFPEGNFVVFDQPPATYSYNFKFGTGASAITSPTKSSAVLSTANKNVTMGTNQTNTGTVVATTPASSSTSTFTTPSGYTCSDYTGSLGTKCNYIKSCVNSTTAANGFYQTNLGQYTFTTSNTSSIQAAATAAVNACQ